MNIAISEYIKSYGETLSLPQETIIDAEDIIRQYAANNKRALQGHNIEVVSCAGILLSCKKHNIPLNAKMISTVITIPTLRKDGRKDLSITKVARKISRSIDLRPESISIDIYIDLLISKLGFVEDGAVRQVSKRIMRLVPEDTNSTPQVLATTVVYITARMLSMTITEKECVSVLRITEPSLRKCKRQLIRYGIIRKVHARYFWEGKDEEIEEKD